MPDATPPNQPKRRRTTVTQRVLAALVGGAGVEEISTAERLTRTRTEAILREALRSRWIAPAEEFARLQITRLERMIAKLVDPIQKGDLEAIDRALKIVDRLDRYHGFSKAKRLPERYDDEDRGAAPQEDQRGRRAPPAAKTRRMTDEAAEPAGPAGPAGSGERIMRIADLVNLELETRVQVLQEMTPRECAQLFHDWRFWARDDQAPPAGDWIIWLILAGRGAGKTRAGAEAVRAWVDTYPIVNLIGATLADARDIMVRGESGILACCRRDERPEFHATDLRLEWPNGAVSQLFSAEEPDRLRGKQHMKLWCDELAAWRQPDAFDQAMLGLRLGDRPQAVVTTTPRPSKIIKALAAGKDTIVTRGSTFDNKAHLARAFFERITARYKGRAIGQQELFAEIVEETPGALWTRALLERQRVAPEAAPKEFAEIVVAVDPPARSGSKSDECGLVVAGESGKRPLLRARRLDEPGRDARRVGGAGRRRLSRLQRQPGRGRDQQGRRHGGRGAAPERAQPAGARGVTRRAASSCAPSRSPRPTSAGLVFHVGAFAKLEDQLCALTPDFDRRAAGFSPDRADALVWALADLLGVGAGEPGGDV